MEGFYVPIRRSVTTPILLGGVPRDFALVNGIASLAVVVGLGALFWIPLGLLIHFVGVLLAKWDPYFLEVTKRHLNEKPYYHA